VSVSNPAAEALLALIGEACEHLSELRTHTDDPASLVDSYYDQLDNIATTAELAGMADVHNEATDKISKLRNLCVDDSHALQREFETLEAWAESLYRSLQMPATDSNGQYTASPFDAPAGSADESAFTGYESVDSGDESAGNTLLQALADELRENIDAMPAAMHEQPEAAAAAQLELVQRFRIACATLGVHSLHEAFGFLEDNLTQLQGRELDAQQAALLPRWPALIQAYLDQNDDNAAAEFVEVLEDSAWPQPLQENAARLLLVALAEIPEHPDENEPERLLTAGDEHVSLQLPGDLSPELLDAFFQESPAQAVELSERLQNVAAGIDVAANVRAAQRLAHTLKGAGNLIGANGVANIAHYLEDVLEPLQSNVETVSTTLGHALQDAADCLEAMIDALLGHAEPPDNAVAVLQKILDCARSADSAAPVSDTDLQANTATGTLAPDPDSNPAVAPDPDSSQPQPQPQPATADATQHMRVATDTVDEMFRMAGEVTIGMAQIQDRIQRLLREGDNLRNQDLVLQKARLELENQVSVRSIAAAQRQAHTEEQGGFDSLEMDRYDALYGSAHTFIESAVDLREMSMDLQSQLQQLDSLLGNQQRLNNELQGVILGTRMVPVSTITARLQRTVRQASRTLGRVVEFSVRGDDLLLDNDVLRAIADPLMHVLRNAVDHGIEVPEERESAGKRAAGQLQLSFQQEGNHVVARICDDGRGIDYQALRDTAVARGLLSDQVTHEPADLRRLMLIPGFTTRTSVTQVSGRGVGMDVVHAAVTALKGSLDIYDNDTHGCTVQLRLPVTLIANHCLLVEVAGQRLAVPSYTLERITAPGVGELTTLSQELRYKLGRDVYPARHLQNLLHGNVAITTDSALAVLLVSVDQDVVAVTVERVLESRELVVKSMGKYVKSVPGVAGVSVLGDGSVVPVLDLPALLRAPASTAVASRQFAQLDTGAGVRNALIVDDSLSVRRALAGLAEDTGYRAFTARDGLEAIKVLEEHAIDIALTDLEMPRVNGLEFTQYVRADAKFCDLPVIMITSRGMGKHRRLAEAAGVNVYLNKPVSNNDLLAIMDDLVEERRINASAA
jgi:chemosensory pili system protein ChpA (sensor histidine kinase/response regulator)